ncbi:MAG: hypothetical protein WAR79_15210 [Melioribacteraceae bacterium]
MKIKIILSSIALILIISFGCNEEETAPIVPQNTRPIEHLSIKVQGCQSSEILLKTNDVGWSYSNDTLKIAYMFKANCYSKFSHTINSTENKIEIYLTNVSNSSARCMCNFQETFSFYAESPKKIKVYFYYRSKSTDEYEDMAFSSIEI